MKTDLDLLDYCFPQRRQEDSSSESSADRRNGTLFFEMLSRRVGNGSVQDLKNTGPMDSERAGNLVLNRVCASCLHKEVFNADDQGGKNFTRIQKKIAESKEAFSDSREFHIKYLRVVDRRPSIFCREERDSDLSKHMLHGNDH